MRFSVMSRPYSPGFAGAFNGILNVPWLFCPITVSIGMNRPSATDHDSCASGVGSPFSLVTERKVELFRHSPVPVFANVRVRELFSFGFSRLGPYVDFHTAVYVFSCCWGFDVASGASGMFSAISM